MLLYLLSFRNITPSMPVNPRARAIETVGRIARIRGKRNVDKAFAPTERAWHFVDAYGLVLGRLASRLVPLLCGKHKPTYSPVQDMGDYVVVTNAAKVVYTGNKFDQKKYYRHSGRPGGMSLTSLRELIAKNPVVGYDPISPSPIHALHTRARAHANV